MTKLNLDLLALNHTADPFYTRFDGTAPEKEGLLLASADCDICCAGDDSVSHKIYYFINDHLGTPLKMMDSDGEIVWAAEYQPFGRADIMQNTIENNFRFPGQYHDTETDLHYNWHRYYDPDTGRYLTPDPIGLAGGINLFVYSKNGPIINIDPFGLVNWKKVSMGSLEATGGGIGVFVAATSGVTSIGSAAVFSIGLSTLAVPAVSHGVSEIIIGLFERDDIIPPASGPAVTTMLFTADVQRAKDVDFIIEAMNLGRNIGTWVNKAPKIRELFSSGVDFVNLLIESKDKDICGKSKIIE